MRQREVGFRPRTEADLFDLYDYIAASSGRAVAGRYIDRIEAACLALAQFPNRGRNRDDLRPGLRVLGFERRVTIAYVLAENDITIARVFYGGRDYEAALEVSQKD